MAKKPLLVTAPCPTCGFLNRWKFNSAIKKADLEKTCQKQARPCQKCEMRMWVPWPNEPLK